MSLYRYKSKHLVLSLVVLTTVSASSAAESKVSFNRDIRPILSDKCFHCHGPDEKNRKADLRLDVREAAVESSIVPGDPAASELINRVTTSDTDDIMPPPDSHKLVSQQEVEILKRWVKQGAPYEGHWAFIKPRRVDPPRRTANPIDAFIQEKLEEAGLHGSPEAPRETLIRRVTFDLTGLPPTVKEVEDFVHDIAPGAYERVVDRLLVSPRYGEHMASRWLDLARYADSNGFQTDSSRTMWPWRDWVINAYNSNMPFDEFTVEQLAGDLLPNPGHDQLVATGFNRNNRLNGESGIIRKEWFIENVIDRVETTGQTWMALTVNCARCHDHKFDPFTQKEFYQLFAFFNSNDESGILQNNRAGGNTAPILNLPTPEQKERLAALELEVKNTTATLAGVRKNIARDQKNWEAAQLAAADHAASVWADLNVSRAVSVGGAILTKQTDDSFLVSDRNPLNDTYEIEADLPAGLITGVLLEVFPDNSLPRRSLGRAGNGNFVLSKLEATVLPPDGAEPINVTFVKGMADYEQTGWKAQSVVDGTSDSGKVGWAVGGNISENRVPRKALFLSKPVAVAEGSRLVIRLIHASPYRDHNIGRFRLSTTSLPAEQVSLEGKSVSADVLSALRTTPTARTKEAASLLRKRFLDSSANPARAAEEAKKAADAKLAEARSGILNTMIFRELPEPRPATVLIRGEYDKPGPPVERRLPAFLPPKPEGAPDNRLGLARWLVSGEHPLTARVWVNREWERFFGTGIVKTTEDLGSQAEWPSHPELLDWLATEFVRLKWDMKAMQRLIVTSAAYRQSSDVTPEQLERDPANRLISHASRIRLTAEEIRDQAVAVSGMLVEKIGGPSVKPYMPARVWDETSVYGNMRGYKADTGDGLYRRTLYTIWKRTAAPPSMLLFDSPNREICTVKRSRSNTPLQALALLNEITYVEAARNLAQTLLKKGDATPKKRVELAFEITTARKPDADEVQTLLTGLEKRLDYYRAHPDEAASLISQGDSKPDPALDPAELAAYTVTASILLNLDEVVTRN